MRRSQHEISGGRHEADGVNFSEKIRQAGRWVVDFLTDPAWVGVVHSSSALEIPFETPQELKEYWAEHPELEEHQTLKLSPPS